MIFSCFFLYSPNFSKKLQKISKNLFSPSISSSSPCIIRAVEAASSEYINILYCILIIDREVGKNRGNSLYYKELYGTLQPIIGFLKNAFSFLSKRKNAHPNAFGSIPNVSQIWKLNPPKTPAISQKLSQMYPNRKSHTRKTPAISQIFDRKSQIAF